MSVALRQDDSEWAEHPAPGSTWAWGIEFRERTGQGGGTVRASAAPAVGSDTRALGSCVGRARDPSEEMGR